MRNFLTCTALLVFVLAAGAAYAASPPSPQKASPASPAVSAPAVQSPAVPSKPKPRRRHPHDPVHWTPITVVGAKRHWEHPGADRYATPTSVYTDAKLDHAFKDMQAAPIGVAGVPYRMPDYVVANLKQLIHDHPEGTESYMTPGVLIPMMETGHHGPMYDLDMKELLAGYGMIKAAKIRAWSVMDQNGYVWQVGWPLICDNVSLLKVERRFIPPPLPPLPALPPAEQPCDAVKIVMKAGTSVHERDIAEVPMGMDICGPTLQMPWEHEKLLHLPHESCPWLVVCTFERPANDLRKQEHRPGLRVQTAGSFDFTAPKDGVYTFWVPHSVVVTGRPHFITFCFIYRGKESYAKPIDDGSFYHHEAWVLAQPDDPNQHQMVPADWLAGGKVTHNVVYTNHGPQ